VSINNEIIPESSSMRYLRIHLDKTFNWKEHTVKKRKHIDAKIKEFYWLLGRKSYLNLENKILIYKTVIKSMWTYGMYYGTTKCSGEGIQKRE
jgi:hypothetical protein